MFLLNSFELPLLKRLVIFVGRIPLSRENKETEIVDQVEKFKTVGFVFKVSKHHEDENWGKEAFLLMGFGCIIIGSVMILVFEQKNMS